jgi:WD40 repeat protein
MPRPFAPPVCLALVLSAAAGAGPAPSAAQPPVKPGAAPKPAAAPADPPREIVLPSRGARHGIRPVFTADGSSLLWWDGKGIAVWDLAQEKVVGTIDAPGWQYNLSADGKLLAADPEEGQKADWVVKVYDVAARKELHTLARPAGGGDREPGFRSCGFDAKGAKLFTRTDQDLQVWDVKTGKMLRRVKTQKPPHLGYMTAGTPDGRYLTVHDRGATVCVLDTLKETVQDVNVPTRDIGPLIGRPNGGFLASFGAWNFAPDGRSLLFTDQINSVYLEWSLAQGKLARGAQVPGLLFVTASPDGSRLVARYKGPPGKDKGDEEERKVLRVLDRKTLKEVATLGPLSKAVGWCATSPDNRWVFGSATGDARLWDLGGQPKKK